MLIGQLVNTDTFRLSVLEPALQSGIKDNPLDVTTISQRTIQRLKYFMPSFKQAISVYQDAVLTHTCKEDHYKFLKNNLLPSLKQFIEKALKLYNEEIASGMTKKSFGYCNALKNCKLSTDEGIIIAGKQVIEGEHQRILEGGVPIQEPRIAIVKIKYDQFVEVYRIMQFSSQAVDRAKLKLVEMRGEADDIIMSIREETDALSLEAALGKEMDNEVTR